MEDVNQVRIIGNYPVLTRKRTGLLSFDLAVRRKGELGMPLRTLVELYGRPECIAGNTKIRVRVGHSGSTKILTMKELYERFNGRHHLRSGIYQIQSSTADGRVRYVNILAAISAGTKPVWKVKTKRCFSLVASADHQFLMAKGGYKKLSELCIGDAIRSKRTIGNGRFADEDKITSIRSVGSVFCYDLHVEGPTNNYCAAGIYVHNSGKSTLAYYLSGVLSESGSIYVCDVDKLLDKDYFKVCLEQSGFKGDAHLIDSTDAKGKAYSHESMLMMLTKGLREPDCGAIVVDSIGAIQPMVEMEEDDAYGQAFMGKRAKLVGQLARSITGILRDKDKPAIALAVNHVHSVIGGRGHITPGGETLKHKASTRIMIYTSETFKDTKDNVLGYLVKGFTEKHTFGGKGREFTYYIVPEFGVHTGASVMFDCFTYKLAERGARVKLEDKSMGYLNADLLTYAAEGKFRKFDAFKNVLMEYETKLMKEGIDNVDDGDDKPGTEADENQSE